MASLALSVVARPLHDYVTPIAYAIGTALILRSSGRKIVPPLFGTLSALQAVFVGLAAGAIGAILEFLWPSYYCFSGPCQPTVAGGGQLLLVAIVVLLLSPIFETIIVQGWIQTRISQSLGLVAAAILAAALFIAMHFGVSVMILVMSVLLSWIRARWSALLPVAIAHSIANLSVLATSLR